LGKRTPLHVVVDARELDAKIFAELIDASGHDAFSWDAFLIEFESNSRPAH
jgi:hypothetical protein